MKVEWSQPCDPERWDTSPDCCIEWRGRRGGGFDPLFVLWERDLHGRVTWGIFETLGRGMVPPRFTKKIMDAQAAVLSGSGLRTFAIDSLNAGLREKTRQ